MTIDTRFASRHVQLAGLAARPGAGAAHHLQYITPLPFVVIMIDTHFNSRHAGLAGEPAHAGAGRCSASPATRPFDFHYSVWAPFLFLRRMQNSLASPQTLAHVQRITAEARRMYAEGELLSAEAVEDLM